MKIISLDVDAADVFDNGLKPEMHGMSLTRGHHSLTNHFEFHQ